MFLSLMRGFACVRKTPLHLSFANNYVPAPKYYQKTVISPPDFLKTYSPNRTISPQATCEKVTLRNSPFPLLKSQILKIRNSPTTSRRFSRPLAISYRLFLKVGRGRGQDIGNTWFVRGYTSFSLLPLRSLSSLRLNSPLFHVFSVFPPRQFVGAAVNPSP